MVTVFTGCPFAVYQIRPRSVIPALDQRAHTRTSPVASRTTRDAVACLAAGVATPNALSNSVFHTFPYAGNVGRPDGAVRGPCEAFSTGSGCRRVGPRHGSGSTTTTGRCDDFCHYSRCAEDETINRSPARKLAREKRSIGRSAPGRHIRRQWRGITAGLAAGGWASSSPTATRTAFRDPTSRSNQRSLRFSACRR